MTGMPVEAIMGRCNTLRRGRARVAATPDEAAAMAFVEKADWRQAQATLRNWSIQAGRRVFRKEVLSILLGSLDSAASGRHSSLREAVTAAREGRRHQGRPVTARAVGSTLLRKGLEADYTVLLDLERVSSEHVYVALTRATRGMIVFSRGRWLGRRA